MRKNIFFFIILILTSCKPLQVRDVEVIHPDRALVGDISDLFSNVEIIPLETNPNGLIGVVITKILIEENKIFIV